MSSQKKGTGEFARGDELRILCSAYDLREYHSWVFRERPDFQLKHRPESQPFGVEVTNHFRDESQARAVNIEGYIGDLLAGGPHRHKDDVEPLGVSHARITSPDGYVKAENVPSILRQVPSPVERRKGLKSAIQRKSDLSYEADGLSHVNLVIRDWLDTTFDPANHSSGAFIDDEMRAILLSCPFQEVIVVLAQQPRPEGETLSTSYFSVRLVELLLASEYFRVGQALVTALADSEIGDAYGLAMLIARHLTSGRGLGRAVRLRGKVWVKLGDSLASLSDQGGMAIRQLADWPLDAEEVSTSALAVELERKIDSFVRDHDFLWGAARPTHDLPAGWDSADRRLSE